MPVEIHGSHSMQVQRLQFRIFREMQWFSCDEAPLCELVYLQITYEPDRVSYVV